MTIKINIVYISLSGNTKDFVKRLSKQLEMPDSNKAIIVESVNIKELKDFYAMTEPFVTILPSYLEGGNGIHTGYKEILTTKLGDFLTFNENYKNCYGIIGSGNRNFNRQFCLTAKQYAEKFDFPLIDMFELRGTNADVERIADRIINCQDKYIAEHNL